MSAPASEVIEVLRARGLVPADGALPAVDESHRPWFVSLLLGAVAGQRLGSVGRGADAGRGTRPVDDP